MDGISKHFWCSQHGKLFQEGASGSLNKVFPEKRDESISFGSKHWASVYLASTPQQAAAMGLEFPGVNEVKFSIMPLFFVIVLMLMMICVYLHLLNFLHLS